MDIIRNKAELEELLNKEKRDLAEIDIMKMVANFLEQIVHHEDPQKIESLMYATKDKLMELKAILSEDFIID